MSKNNIIILVAAFACMAITSAFAQLKADEKTAAYLRNFRLDYVKGLIDKKPEMIASYCSENIRLMPEFQKTVMGKNNAALYYKAFLARFDMLEYNRNEIEIIDLGSRVVETGLFSMQLLSKRTGHELSVKGKYQSIWEKSKDGKLSLITEAWNHDQRSDMDDQFRFDEVPGVQIAYQSHLPVNDNISFELAALNKLLEATIVQHDSEIWSQFFTDDALLLVNLSPIQKGRKAVHEYLTTHAKELPVFEHLDIRNDHIDNLGAYVIEYASHVANWRNGASSGVGTGKNIRIWRREPDCSLKIIRQIGSYD